VFVWAVIPCAKLVTRLWHTLLAVVVWFVTTSADIILLDLLVNQAKTLLGNVTDVITVANDVGVDVLTLLPKDSLPTRWLHPKLGGTQLNPMSVTI
jgi:hypothetical protein